MIRFHPSLTPAIWLRRHHRFLVDVRLDDGQEITVHTSNTGAMLGCSGKGMRVWIRDSANPKRKYRHSLELVQPRAGWWVGVNTLLANRLVGEGLKAGLFDELSGYTEWRSEVRYGRENSRIDWLLRGAGLPDLYLEVKSVTLCRDGVAYFPDAVTTRGLRHVRELTRMRALGKRAAVFFCVQHSHAKAFAPAADIDSAYASALVQAIDAGVEVLVWKTSMNPHQVFLERRLPTLDEKLANLICS